MASITIDGQEYDLENLSDNARAQLSSIQVADQELNQVNARIALTQTARNAYAKSLSEQLPNPVSEDADAVVTIDNRPYSLSDFSDSAKAELASLQVADQKLSQLQSEVAMVQTARNAYAVALKAALKSVQ